MKNNFSFLLIGLFLAMSITACCYSEETPLFLVSVTGNTSVVTADANETYQCTVNELNSSATVTDINQSTGSIALEKVKPAENCNAAVVITGTGGNKTVFMIQVSDPVYSADNKSFSFIGSSQKYYDGTMLTEYNNNQSTIQSGEYGTTNIYLEYAIPELENTGGCVCNKCVNGHCTDCSGWGCPMLSPYTPCWEGDY